MTKLISVIRLIFIYSKYQVQVDGLTVYRQDLEKQEGVDVVAHERLTEPIVTMESLLAKPRSFSNLPAFLDLNSIIKKKHML